MQQSGGQVVSTIEPSLAGFARPTFRQSTRTLLLTLAVCVAVAFLFPFPATKLVLAVILGVVYLKRLNEDMAFGLALVAFSVPVQDLTPSYIRLFPGMNIATVVMALLLLFWWKHEAERTGNPAERRRSRSVLPSPASLSQAHLQLARVGYRGVTRSGTWSSCSRTSLDSWC